MTRSRGDRSDLTLAASLLAASAVLIASFMAACSSAPPPAPADVSASAPTPAPEPFRHARWADAIVYFVIVDRFADGDTTNNPDLDRSAKGTFHGGDFEGLTRHLDEIADLGVTALWITPVVKNIDGFVTGAGFPDWAYHGYWGDDFTRTDPRFGSEEELRALVEACHRRGIRVLLDVVYNHAGYDSAMTTAPATRDWFRTEALGTCGDDDLTSCIAGLPDFRTELPEVAEFLLSNQLAMARRAGVDGFRLDTVKHLSHDFWQDHRMRTRAELGPEFFLLGEVWGGDADVLDPYFAGDEMDAGFDFGFQGSVLAWLQGRGRTVAFSRYLEKRHSTRAGFYLSHYLSSHDVPGGLFQLGGDLERFRLAVILQMTSVGIPMVYYGEEVGRIGGDWPDNRSDMPWGERDILPGRGLPRDEALRSLYQRLIRLRRDHPALSRGAYQELASTGDVLVFSRHFADSDDQVLVVVNRGGEAATVTVPRPARWSGRSLRDALGDQPFAGADDSALAFEVSPHGARIIEAD
jgi:alpha-amylase